MGNKKKRRSLSTFAILIVVLLLVSAATWLASGQTYTDAETGEQAVVVGAPQRHPDGSHRRLA